MGLATDSLIFKVSQLGLSLLGGNGRAVGWRGIVDLSLEWEPLAARVLSNGRPLRVGSGAEPVRVIGPYWAKFALLAPVGADHLVVFGSEQALDAPDAAFIAEAAQLVAEVGQLSPAKLLADELEVVHAIRELMECRPERTAETCRHIAQTAAEALSCDVGAVLVCDHDQLVAEVITREWPARLDAEAIKKTLVELFQRAERKGTILELEIPPDPSDALGRDQGLVTRLALPIGRPAPFGVLVVAHAESRARGFTNLCQRIGHALAESAESLLEQSLSREALEAERDRLAREARIDALTRIENRTAWEELIAVEQARVARHPTPLSIVSGDLDNLKAVNDRLGHAAGDRMLCAAADVLKRCSRKADRIARVGGDEFLILLPNTDAIGAARYIARVRAAMERIHLQDRLSMSLGAATAAAGEPLAAVIARADAAMYAAKKLVRDDLPPAMSA